jgi:hypothetical protein
MAVSSLFASRFGVVFIGLVAAMHIGCDKGPALGDRIAVGDQARRQLQLTLSRPPSGNGGDLAAALKVSADSSDSSLWAKALSHARFVGCAYYSASGEYFGQFRVSLSSGNTALPTLPLSIHVTLDPIRANYRTNEHFRSRLGKQRVAAFIFLNFDNEVFYEMDEIRARSLCSNCVYLGQQELRKK